MTMPESDWQRVEEALTEYQDHLDRNALDGDEIPKQALESLTRLRTASLRQREALEPFAKAAESADEYDRPDEYDTEGIFGFDCGDLRRARSALAETIPVEGAE